MGIFWYVFLGFTIFYLYKYFTGQFDSQYWNTIYVLLAIGFAGWMLF